MQTIFALSTAPGKAGVAIIRISGENAEIALRKLIRTETPKARKATLKNLYAPETNEVIDRGLVLWFPAPHSFTGEDMVELQIHGSFAVINEITEHLSSLDDIRMAEAGEFSRRAFENGKMDLTQAEGLADLIASETKEQKKQALQQMDGNLTSLYENWRSQLLKILAHVEAYIDFPDEEISMNTRGVICAKATNLQKEINHHISNRVGEIIRNGISVAIIGAPNVGKSSLINYLAKRDVAIVSETAGTTRDIIEVHLDIAGYPVILSDTAGLRENTNTIESEGIKRALKKAEQSDITICIFDANCESKFDTKTIQHINKDSVLIMNKMDIVGSRKIPKKIENMAIIPISIHTNCGMSQLLKVLKAKIKSKASITANNPPMTRQRHRVNLKECAQYLETFTTGLENNTNIELAADDLRIAAVALGKTTGRISVEETLGEIFNSFCIGK